MFAVRNGLPRSELSSSGLTAFAASAIAHARLASSSFPRTREHTARPAPAPATPPVKKYVGISQVQTGRLITGWP